MEKKIIARKIRALMMLKGINTVELAKRLGVSRTWLSLVIHGHAKSPRIRKGIARILGVKEEELWKEA